MDQNTTRLLNVAERLLERVKQAGADAADVAVATATSKGVDVRLGKVEETESSETESVSLRVFVGKRVASVSGDTRSDLSMLAERAVAMAKVSPPDEYASLADPDRLAKDLIDLDQFDPTEVSPDELRDAALAMEDAARAVPGVTNSGGASAGAGSVSLVLATTTGFRGHRTRTSFSRSVSVVGGEGTRMQRDYDFDSRLHYSDLDAPDAIGLRAGERVVRRLDPGGMPTGRVPVIFDPRVARGLIASLVSAINGAAIARGTSFLKRQMGEQVLPESMTLTDEPTLKRRPGSKPFDGEGVAGEPMTLVENGILKTWLLDTATANELGLQTNGRASRSGAGLSPSATNVILNPGAMSSDELTSDTGTGLYVDEMIGHGANLVTGDYSRGASGFLIENGKLTRPVSEITIAGNLKDMLLSMTAADDLDTRFSVVAPTLRVAQMMIAGR
ncbi:modulator of DNA gyrase protein [Fulvimarina pelagi HTCC2506]|uniref:Modulator of DNA gyrase protein n=1 Tax=Fulvimarina pelagi HTCC2506 TaxID=314231 RepID=Q0G3U2_9HYPH|nr:TldD/PmbA family protein [Fulvimarina pelagi]EAU41739.1 modulator of DNA gyrase protein [Fulvimarina pelagi HTCC2506]